jgi:REP element-mobilizing transposase RayT
MAGVVPGCAARRWALLCNAFGVFFDDRRRANYDRSRRSLLLPGFRNVSQSLVQIYVHLVFSTKNRQPFLRDERFRDRLHAYLAGICNNHESPALKIGGVEDHVHIVARLGKTIDIAALIRELKRDSSKWIKAESPNLADFAWQSGYGAFSVSPSHVDPLVKYVANQVEHHRRETFQDEFRRLCAKYGVPIDERYVWD